MTSRAIQRNPVSKNQNQQNKKEFNISKSCIALTMDLTETARCKKGLLADDFSGSAFTLHH